MAKPLRHWLYGRVCAEKEKSSLPLFVNHGYAGRLITAAFSLACLEAELLCDFDTLGQVGYPGINGVPLSFQPDALFPEVNKLYVEDLDEFVLLQFRLQVLVLWKAHIHAYMNHLEVRITEARVCSGVLMLALQRNHVEGDCGYR
jgi:hypothetical protein